MKLHIAIYPHTSKKDIEETIKTLEVSLDELKERILNGEYFDKEKCGNCGGIGWSYKNGFDCQTVKCHCSKKQKVKNIK